DGPGQQVGDVAPETGDLAAQGRGDERQVGPRGQEHRVDLRDGAVHVRHRQFVVVVRRVAQPLDHGGGALLAAVVHEQPVEAVDPYPGDVGADLLDEGLALG